MGPSLGHEGTQWCLAFLECLQRISPPLVFMGMIGINRPRMGRIIGPVHAMRFVSKVTVSLAYDDINIISGTEGIILFNRDLVMNER